MAFWDDQSIERAFYELREAIRTLQTQSPLRSSSITEGRLRVGGTAILLIDSDGGVVIQGSLDGDGSFEWTGAASFTGSLTVSGPIEITGNLTAKGTTRFEGDTTQVGAHHVQGNQDITGTLAVKGAATLESDLTVAAGGRVLVGSAMKLVPSVDGGSVEFADGSRLSSNGTTTGVRAGASRMEISDAIARLTISGRGLTINSGGYQMTSMPTTTVAANPGSFIGALVIDAAGNLKRVAS